MITKQLPETKSDVCPICGGLGVVTRNVPIDHPDFGKAFPCTCQRDKVRVRRLERLRDLGNLGAYGHKVFANFQIDYTRLDLDESMLRDVFPDMPEERRQSLDDKQKAQINTAAEMAYLFAISATDERERPWMLLKGSYGTGKTHLAAAIANFCVERGQPVLFITVPDLLDHLRGTYGPSSEVAYDEEFERVRNAEMLVLDDLGAESPTAWAVEKLYQLFSFRHLKRLPTIITTNSEPEAFDPRIRSRLLDHSLTHISSLEIPDMRSPLMTWQDMDLTKLDRHEGQRFDTFDLRKDESLPDADVKRLERTLKVAWNFAQRPEGWLVLMGEAGSGKTHLAAAIAFELNQHNQRTLFVTTSDLLDHLRATFYPGSSVRFDKRLEEIKQAPVLVLDDVKLRAEGDREGRSLSNWSRDKLYEILLLRFDRRLPTVITTHLAVQELESRFRSRVTNQDVCVIEAITVPSYPGKTAKRKMIPPPKR